VLLLLVEPDLVVVEREHDAAYAHAREARLAHLLDHVAVLALALAHERREHQELRAPRELHHLVDDLLRRLLRDGPAAAVAGEPAHARPQHAQVVVDLGDGADRRAGVGARGLLLDRDGGCQALDRVVERLFHLPEELPGVGGQALDVAALALGVERVERERRLAGARDAGHDHERLLRDRDRDVLEVVLACSGDDDTVGLHQVTSVCGREGQTKIIDRSRQTVDTQA
jgi:PAS domain-containing protein